MGVALRLVYLDADPDYYAWIGYITDEGRWLKHARDLALFGHVIGEEQGLHVHLAPLFHLAHAFVFKLVGVSFVTTRVLTALSGCALLVVAWAFLRRVATPQALVVALMLLAFEVDLIAMSRVAIPEMPAMLFQFVAFAVILTPPAGPVRMMRAGFWLLLAVAAKVTVLGVVPIFAALVVQVSREGSWHRFRNISMFCAGLCGPVVPVALVWLIRRGGIETRSLRDTVDVIRAFLEPSSVYSAVSLPFDSTLAPLFNVWGMVACLAFLGWIASTRDARSSAAHDCYISSLVWFGTYSLVTMSLDYFPDRYRIHLLVPLALNVAAGLTLFQEAGLTGVTRALGRMHPTKRLLSLAVFGLPTAAIWAPLLASGYQLVGSDAAHLRVRIAAVAVALVSTVVFLDRRLRQGQALLPFIVFPVVGALAWLISDRLDLEAFPFWPAPRNGPWTWTLGMGWVILLASWALERLLVRQTRFRRFRMIPVAAAVYAMLSLVRILPSYVAPQYTMRQTSESLGRELAEVQGIIAADRAESLFHGNALRYWNTPTPREQAPDAVIVAFGTLDPKLAHAYRVVTQHYLFISPRYVFPPGQASELLARLPVRVYQRSHQ
jgi:hypothetical protein